MSSYWFNGLDLKPSEYHQGHLLYELRGSTANERILCMMQFPNYCDAAKRDPTMRSTVIQDCKNRLGKVTTPVNVELFCRRLLLEFIKYDRATPVDQLLNELWASNETDLAMDLQTNRYHRKLINKDPESNRKLKSDTMVEEIRKATLLKPYLGNELSSTSSSSGTDCQSESETNYD